MNYYTIKDEITEDEVFVARINYLQKMVRVSFDKAQKEKDKGNEENFKKHYGKFREYKNELDKMKEAM